jgi:hypothetical protein
LGFVKVEISDDMLTLSFPSPEEKLFYEGDDAPFQHIMQHVRKIPQYHPRLNQHTQELKLTAHLPSTRNDRERLQILKTFFDELKN